MKSKIGMQQEFSRQEPSGGLEGGAGGDGGGRAEINFQVVEDGRLVPYDPLRFIIREEVESALLRAGFVARKGNAPRWRGRKDRGRPRRKAKP